MIDKISLGALLKKEDESGCIECSPALMILFLDGLIIQKRGANKHQSVSPVKVEAALNNNTILKKLRIALELKEEDMISIMNLVDIDISKSELSALFRNKEHKKYKECGDQFLRNFLKGLTIRNRNHQSADHLHSD